MTAIVERARETAARITDVEARGLHAVLAWDSETIAAQAETIARRAEPGPLAGMPVAIKDNICTVEYPTTCGSRLLEGYRSPDDATAVVRLRRAGAIVACKTNLDEFGMGSSTEYSAFGRTRHPTDPDRVPGGSSGGSAALVASGAVEAALGSDTGGSVRQPAAFCGVVGLKPTYGRVSRFGLVAFGSSLDQIGVFARRARVAASVFRAIAGADPRDATCIDTDAPDIPLDDLDLERVTIGVPREYFPDDLDGAIRRACEDTLAALRQAGATVRDVSLPHTPLAIPAYYVIAPAEASANLARFDGVRYGHRAADAPDIGQMYRDTRGSGFGREVQRRIVVGTYVLSAGYREAYYGRALLARARIAADFRNVFAAGVDYLLTPTTPTTAFRAGSHTRDPVSMYREDAFVCPVNLAGVPAVSMPVGRAGGLPVGAQLVGPHESEPGLLALAALLERLVDPMREFA